MLQVSSLSWSCPHNKLLSTDTYCVVRFANAFGILWQSSLATYVPFSKALGPRVNLSMNNDEKLKQFQMDLENRKYSYDLTQKLTFFIISAELVFCGYVLVNAEKIAQVKHSSSLFLISALAALLGVIWRFLYNQSYHDNAHGIKKKWYMKYFQIPTYFLYVLLSFVLFISLTYMGYSYIKQKEASFLAKPLVELKESPNK